MLAYSPSIQQPYAVALSGRCSPSGVNYIASQGTLCTLEHTPSHRGRKMPKGEDSLGSGNAAKGDLQEDD